MSYFRVPFAFDVRKGSSVVNGETHYKYVCLKYKIRFKFKKIYIVKNGLTSL